MNKLTIIISILFLISFITIEKGQSNSAEVDNYSIVKQKFNKIKDETKSHYIAEISIEKQNKILANAFQKIFSIFCEELLPAWFGTEWGFNGVSRIPGEEKYCMWQFCCLHFSRCRI